MQTLLCLTILAAINHVSRLGRMIMTLLVTGHAIQAASWRQLFAANTQ